MLLIGTDEGIYRWAEGNNWPVFHALQGRAVVGLASPGAGVLAAIDGGGRAWESADNGLSWRELPVPDGLGRPTTLAVGGSPASILVASRGRGAYRRILGDRRRSGSPFDRARELAPVLLQRARSLANRRSGGATAVAEPPAPLDLRGWGRLDAPMAETPGAEVLAIATIAGGWLVAVAGQGLWRSDDDAASWSKVDALPASVHAIRTVPGRDGRLLAATSDGVWASDDSGRTWEDRSKGLESVRHVRAIEARPDEPDYLLAGAAPASAAGATAAPRDGLGYGLYESRDGGKSWGKVVRSFPESLAFDAIADIRFDPASPDNAAVAFESGEMWMTLNGGDYWQPFARDIRAARVLLGVT